MCTCYVSQRYHEHSSTERRVKRDMSARYEMSLQRRALRSWKIVVVHLQEEREHLHLARAHHASLTLAKVNLLHIPSNL